LDFAPWDLELGFFPLEFGICFSPLGIWDLFFAPWDLGFVFRPLGFGICFLTLGIWTVGILLLGFGI
jgi:hypothetical protein